ncbi:cuticle protein 8-like [Penaeus japonicus]|uniref:cuticle protein 8-like n=1 Tax=Penaeus japonicus TaxID=27405 RepID=UPI001C7119BD|nr:cuticle protein 8-like [Penaeus japonicus]
MFLTLSFVLGLAAAALGAPSQPPHGYAPAPSYQSPAQYNFDWLVKDDYSANDFGQQESRDGYNTQGSYYVQLPDGRLQRVTYHVDGDSGYVAEVSYEGEAQYQAHQPAYHTTPSYHPTPAYRPTPSYSPNPHH